MEKVIESKVKAFARAILDSHEYKEFLDAEKALQQDKTALSLLEELESKRREFTLGADETVLEEVAVLQEKIRKDESISRYEEAQNRLLSLLAQADRLISSKIGAMFAQPTGRGGCCG